MFPLLLTILTCIMGLMAFQKLLLLEYGGGPEKDRDVCFCGGTLRMLSPDSSCQQDVLWHDGNSPGVDGTQVGIIKQPDKVCLRCLLETQYRCCNALSDAWGVITLLSYLALACCLLLKVLSEAVQVVW